MWALAERLQGRIDSQNKLVEHSPLGSETIAIGFAVEMRLSWRDRACYVRKSRGSR